MVGLAFFSRVQNYRAAQTATQSPNFEDRRKNVFTSHLYVNQDE